MDPSSAPQTPASPPIAPPPSPAPTPPPGTPVGWGAPPPAQNLPDEDAGRKHWTLVVLIILIAIALGVAAYIFVPWPQKPSGGPTGATTSLEQIEASMQELDTLVDEIDANMVGVDPSLADQQGSLVE
jgi:hypothetical protein